MKRAASIIILLAFISCKNNSRIKDSEVQLAKHQAKLDQITETLEYQKKQREFHLQMSSIMRQTGISEDSISRAIQGYITEDSLRCVAQNRAYLWQ